MDADINTLNLANEHLHSLVFVFWNEPAECHTLLLVDQSRSNSQAQFLLMVIVILFTCIMLASVFEDRKQRVLHINMDFRGKTEPHK
jgi:hypothetical protein